MLQKALTGFVFLLVGGVCIISHHQYDRFDVSFDILICCEILSCVSVTPGIF